MNNVFDDIKRPTRRCEDGSPVFTQVIRLPKEFSGMANSIVKLENSNVKRFGRRSAVAIINRNNRKKVIRYVMGNGGDIKGLKKHCLSLDYDAILDLNIDYDTPVNIRIRQATVLESMMWLYGSPDINVRMSFILGLLGAALGFIGLLISLIGLI